MISPVNAKSAKLGIRNSGKGVPGARKTFQNKTSHCQINAHYIWRWISAIRNNPFNFKQCHQQGLGFSTLHTVRTTRDVSMDH